MNRNGKPILKCRGCILNLGERCAVYVDPYKRWYHSRCLHYNDKEFYNEYIENLKKDS
ncbi:MAG: hypothetical protein ACE5GU_06585 [Candidatus Scalinduaceae bacterium]